MNSHLRNSEYWDLLVSRYYEAETSPEEERLLKQFLASEDAADPKYDEIRAVMGFLSTGRHLARQKKAKRKIRMATTIAAAAACIALGIFVTKPLWLVPKTDDICIAYVNGKTVTQPDKVMELMMESMQNVTDDTSQEALMEQQLSDIFNTPSE